VRPWTTFAEDITVFAEVMAVNGGLVALSKFIVQRPTPQAYAGDKIIHDPGGYLSFYSGHTSFTFAALSFGAVTLSVRDRPRLWPWIATGVVGGGVGAAMVLAGAHFPTDVAMGAAAGTVVGVTVPLLHMRTPRPLRLTLVPGPEGRGLALRGRF
jgi:membrane-associated phospholipid phosphatase